jgi:predicted O-methyltransferase YrrM
MQSPYRTIAETVLAMIDSAAPESALNRDVPWHSFETLLDRLPGFAIPSTTISPAMAHLLFALSAARQPRRLFGAGTYVGYGFSFLVAAIPACSRAVGCDIDAGANAIARQNAVCAGLAERVSYEEGDACLLLAGDQEPIDLIFIDIDDPVSGKLGYADVFQAVVPHLSEGAMVLAHDASVPRFSAAFERYHEAIRQSGVCRTLGVMPVDECGLSIAVRIRSNGRHP